MSDRDYRGEYRDTHVEADLTVGDAEEGALEEGGNLWGTWRYWSGGTMETEVRPSEVREWLGEGTLFPLKG